VQAYRAWLDSKGLAPSSINLRLSAIRKLASEAARSGLLETAVASAIRDVPNIPVRGIRAGKWLAWEEAKELLNAPSADTTRGRRDRALLSVLIACGLRRAELTRLRWEDLQLRDGRWVFVDLIGKGRRVRSVPVPLWVKQALDSWHEAASTKEGPIFRRVHAGGSVGDKPLTEKAIWGIVNDYAPALGLGAIAPHDLRRTCAKLCRAKGGELEQIQFLLGHASVVTTERYLGSRQNLRVAVNDTLIFE
jgi:integrase